MSALRVGVRRGKRRKVREGLAAASLVSHDRCHLLLAVSTGVGETSKPQIIGSEDWAEIEAGLLDEAEDVHDRDSDDRAAELALVERLEDATDDLDAHDFVAMDGSA